MKDEETILDEDARFSMFPWHGEGYCKECNVKLCEGEDEDGKFQYCSNTEDCSLGTNQY